MSWQKHTYCASKGSFPPCYWYFYSLYFCWCIFILHIWSVSITFWIYSQPCLCSHAGVCVSGTCVQSPTLGYLEGSVLQSVGRIGPRSALSRGASTERLFDAKWTGNFSNLNTPPENSSCLFLTLIFPLIMCGQPANLSKNKSEWFRQLLLFHIV